MCLHLLIRQQKLYRGFYGNDLAGIIRLVASKWYYIAFVFDSVTRTQSIYLDGILLITIKQPVMFIKTSVDI